MFWIVFGWYSFYKPTTTRPRLWTPLSRPTEEVNMTCYEHTNGTWLCAPDVDLLQDVDGDDSY